MKLRINFINVLLSAFKLALLASFKVKILLVFERENEVRRANLNTEKRMLKCNGVMRHCLSLQGSERWQVHQRKDEPQTC